MNERHFVEQKRTDWDELAALVTKANSRGGMRTLTRDEVKRLGPLYRRAASDLARARRSALNEDLIQHLNSLVGRAHALLYEAEVSGNAAQSVYQFYLYEFPALLQKRCLYFLAALGLTLFGVFFAYWQVSVHPAAIDHYIPPQFKESVQAWKEGKVEHSGSAEFSGQLMANNQRVGLVAYASGLAAGIPTMIILYDNGATLGALSALITQVHQHGTFWPGILPHGIAELTAIFICGAAGLLLGMSLLAPGPYSRGDALKLAGIDSVKLVLGTLPLFLFAGIVEGMFSHLGLPGWVRLTFAGLNGTLWYLYLFLPRRMAGGRSLHLRDGLPEFLPRRMASGQEQTVVTRNLV